MRYSDNYNLKLPQRGVDRANVDDLDSNFETIDGALADDRQISLLMYDSTSTYNTGDIVGYENPTTHRIRAFRCLEDNVTGTWDGTKWAQTTLADEIGQGGGGTDVEANPSGTATTDLEKLRVGQTIYGIPSATDMTGATSQAAGTHGLVPAPSAGDEDKVLYGDGTWKTPQSGVSELSQLNDVNFTTPTQGQAVTYDETNSKWVNSDLPAVTKTASGNPVEFSDGANAPLVKCVSAITGSQDLHGYDKPWVGGAGKNKFQNKQTTRTNNGITYTVNPDGSVFIAGGQTSTDASILNLSDNLQNPNSYYPLTDMGLQYDTDYIMTGCPSGGSTSTYRMTFRSGGSMGNIVDSGTGANVNIASDAPTLNWSVCIMIASGYTIPSGGLTFKPMLRLSTESDPTFSPYSNICPITAYNQSTISVHGRNIVKAFTTMSNTQYAVALCADIELKPSTTYVLSFKNANVSSFYSNESLFDGQSNFSVTTAGGRAYAVVTTKSVLDKTDSSQYDTTNGWRLIKNWATQTNGFSEVMLETGSSASDYEPFTGNSESTATFTNSIYQGNADFVGGEATAEWGYIASYNGETLPGEWISSMDEYAPGTTPTIGAEVAYELATPTTETITPTNLPIKSLSGYNHIESTTGDLEVEYITQQQQPIVDLISESGGGGGFTQTILYTATAMTDTEINVDLTAYDEYIIYANDTLPSAQIPHGNSFPKSVFQHVLSMSNPNIILYGYSTAYCIYTVSSNKLTLNESGLNYRIVMIVGLKFGVTPTETRSLSLSKGGEPEAVDKVDKVDEEKKVDEPLDKTVDEQKEELTKEPLEPISEPLETKTDSLSKDDEKAEIEDESKEIEEVTEEPTEEEPEVTEEEPTEEPVDPEPSKEEADER